MRNAIIIKGGDIWRHSKGYELNQNYVMVLGFFSHGALSPLLWKHSPFHRGFDPPFLQAILSPTLCHGLPSISTPCIQPATAENLYKLQTVQIWYLSDVVSPFLSRGGVSTPETTASILYLHGCTRPPPFP
ncbi:hypothetical protein MtrunA17_Chr5g0438911 [Medicago truncatula]|nr:hypothetical protein MtrunA17_Chr5g0438911 [Medicago truncatula]